MVTMRVIHASPYLAESAPAFSAGSFVFGFSALYYVFPCFLLYSLPVYCSDFIGICVG
jgi:hypothetical protein